MWKPTSRTAHPAADDLAQPTIDAHPFERAGLRSRPEVRWPGAAERRPAPFVWHPIPVIIAPTSRTWAVRCSMPGNVPLCGTFVNGAWSHAHHRRSDRWRGHETPIDSALTLSERLTLGRGAVRAPSDRQSRQPATTPFSPIRPTRHGQTTPGHDTTNGKQRLGHAGAGRAR